MRHLRAFGGTSQEQNSSPEEKQYSSSESCRSSFLLSSSRWFGSLEMIFILLLELSVFFSASAVSPCLDPNGTDYSCEVDSSGKLNLTSCSVSDEDVDSGDLALCFDTAGRGNITDLILSSNDLTTLPESTFRNLTALTELDLDSNALTNLTEGIFHDSTALESLYLGSNDLVSLPDSIFQSLTALETLSLNYNAFVALPEGIFHGSTALERLYLGANVLNALPEAIFENLTALATLSLAANDLAILPEGIFHDCTALERLLLRFNALTTLPENIFQNLTALTYLDITGNSMECLPNTTLVEIDDDASSAEDGLDVDAYGNECGCSIVNVTDNVCGEEACTPGPTGYTCGPSPAHTAAPSSDISATTDPFPIAAPASDADPSPAYTAAPSPDVSATIDPFPTAAPASDAPSTNSPATNSAEQSSNSDLTPILAGVLSTVAFAVLVALAIRLKRRRASTSAIVHPPAPPPTHEHDSLVQGREHRLEDRPRTSTVLAVGRRGDESPSLQHNASPNRYTPAEAKQVDGAGAAPFSSSPENSAGVEHSGAGLASEDTAECSAEKPSTASAHTASASPPNLSTSERADLAQFHQKQREAYAAPGRSKAGKAPGGEARDSSAADRQTLAVEIGLGHAVLAAAEELAYHCQIPGISEAASAVCIMTNLVTDSHENDRACEFRLRQCRTIIMALKRAAKVVEKGEDTVGEVTHELIEEVHVAIFDLVELIKAFQSKKKLSKLLMSTLFKRRQDELDAVVDRAITRLQLGLQVQIGQDVSAVKEEMLLSKGSTAETPESIAEARSTRRRRKLDLVEIPEDHVTITTDLLGKGGFGEVYLADYNGHNAAAKVFNIVPVSSAHEDNQKQRESSQRRAFLRELETMIRLRSPNTVSVYGAVTSLPDRMVLVMELLAGGDLLTLLRNSTAPLPGEQSRRILKDVCTGMAFLHSKNTVHGDLKSANVLLDGDGRAKIADFGTSKWSEHTNYTGLATYTTRSSQSTHMSIAWSAPEVLDSEESTYKSDVYSFGIVVWEVLSRKPPWASKTRPTEIMTAVLRGSRPSFRTDAPVDIVAIANACWVGEPQERTTFRAILEGMDEKGWSDENS